MPTRGTVIGFALPWLNIMAYQLELKERQGEGQVGIHRPPEGTVHRKKSAVTYISAGSETKSQTPQLNRSKEPLYKDPLASSKLEMIKNIRAQRAAAETKKTEAIERAKLLIAEAEKAAKALEVAATRSPFARASLLETRKLIAEAIQSIESIDIGPITSQENGTYPSFASTGLINRVEKEIDADNEGLNGADQSEVNGSQALASSSNDDFDFVKYTLQNLLNDEEELLPTSSDEYGLPPLDLDNLIKQLGQVELNGNGQVEINGNGQVELNGNTKHDKSLPANGAKFQSMREEAPSNSTTVTKKWVRGRLIEVAEGD
ncbi:hypothetical protein L1049_008347 [Liquidambar formosana]|uniref:Uncharacterized protein n=1 Tax=Liquidambar formosana TaxID=63359 RepID=A0AAP0S2W3_LIQFO